MWKVIAAALVCILATKAFAEAEVWEKALTSQLAAQENCELSYLTNIKESAKDGDVQIVGRAHCADGRAFDIEGMKSGKSFALRSCKVNAC
ncbi:MAG: hypothetical protein ACR2OR_10470 [Hyphomicrobiales bacterium]